MIKGNGDGQMEPEKQKLIALNQVVHEVLRTLKMGDTGTIPVADFSPEEVKNYVWAYAMHKGKWFDCKYDKTSKAFTVVRKEPPPWDSEEEGYEEP